MANADNLQNANCNLQKCWESYCKLWFCLQINRMCFSQSTEQVVLLYVLLFLTNSSDYSVTFARCLPCHIKLLIKIKNSCLCFLRKTFILLASSFWTLTEEWFTLLARVITMCWFLRFDYGKDSMARLTAFPHAYEVL